MKVNTSDCMLLSDAPRTDGEAGAGEVPFTRSPRSEARLCSLIELPTGLAQPGRPSEAVLQPARPFSAPCTHSPFKGLCLVPCSGHSGTGAGLTGDGPAPRIGLSFTHTHST